MFLIAFVGTRNQHGTTCLIEEIKSKIMRDERKHLQLICSESNRVADLLAKIGSGYDSKSWEEQTCHLESHPSELC